jgi:hypothetical protein
MWHRENENGKFKCIFATFCSAGKKQKNAVLGMNASCGKSQKLFHRRAPF